MLIRRRPVSLNSASTKYKMALTEEATAAMAGREILRGRLYARIIWFHAEPTTQDADNIVKPILDCLKKVVFEDDSQVGECHVTRIDLSRPYTFVGVPDDETFNRLTEYLVSGEKHIVFINVCEATEQIVEFGLEQEGI